MTDTEKLIGKPNQNIITNIQDKEDSDEEKTLQLSQHVQILEKKVKVDDYGRLHENFGKDTQKNALLSKFKKSITKKLKEYRISKEDFI